MEPPSSPSRDFSDGEKQAPCERACAQSVSIVDEQQTSVDAALLEAVVLEALHCTGIRDGEVCVLLTSDEEVRRLNRRFRRVDEPTDVLTFPSGDPGSGDIAIAVPYAQKQADARGVDLGQEIAYLAIHGALHLAGYDDEEEDDRRTMVRKMNEVARTVGLPEDHEWGSLFHGESEV